MSKRVFITHPLDGREYGIEAKDFTNKRLSPDEKSYAERGFEIVSYDDGTPYDGPKTLAEIEAASAPKHSARNVQPTARPTERQKAE